MKIKALAASVCLSFSGLGLALADTQYTYVGVNYNDAHAPYTTAMSLSGSMVLPATLPASQTDIVIGPDRKSTRLNSSHLVISYAVFCLKKKKTNTADMGAIDSSSKIENNIFRELTHRR